MKKNHRNLVFKSTMCGRTLILVYLTLMVKMEKITFIIYLFMHPTYKIKFKYFNFIHKAYYFVNVFIYQLLCALFFHEKTFLY
jgi:hypothetical protein